MVGLVVVNPSCVGLLVVLLFMMPAVQGQGIGCAVLRQVLEQAHGTAWAVRVGGLIESVSYRFFVRLGFQLVECGEFD
ncbi:GNAT family N-acetyltransferase, partial [Pseudomonas syringae pv. tagetis]